MPVSLNAGFQMPSWFDLKTLDANGPEDEEGIRKATEGIHALINSEIEAGIDASRIILGGFSQGGALALYSGMVYPKKLGGIMALSCWLPLHKSFPAAVSIFFKFFNFYLLCYKRIKAIKFMSFILNFWTKFFNSSILTIKKGAVIYVLTCFRNTLMFSY